MENHPHQQKQKQQGEGEAVAQQVMRVRQLPIGFRFRPTDEEVVVHYLTRKALSLPLPASVIPVNPDAFRVDPASLPGDLNEKRYFFTKRAREAGKKCSRIMSTTTGIWLDVGKNKLITSFRVRNGVVGCRKSWAFYQKTNNNISHVTWNKTTWYMHEFKLPNSTKDQTAGEVVQEWVVCRVFQKKMKKPKNRESHNIRREEFNIRKIIDSPMIIDFTVDNSSDLAPPPPQPSSPSSSIDDN